MPATRELNDALQLNIVLQSRVERLLVKRRAELDLLQLLLQECVARPEADADYSVRKQRYHYHRLDHFALNDDPFRLPKCPPPPDNDDAVTLKALHVALPPPTGFAVSTIVWTESLDDVLTCAVEAYRIQKRESRRPPGSSAAASAKVPVKEEATEDSAFSLAASGWYFGLSFEDWEHATEIVNAVLDSDINFMGLVSRPLSPMDCILHFGNVLLCRQSPFTPVEDAIILQTLREDSGDSHCGPLSTGPFAWTTIAATIAESLGWHRSAFQCASRFQRMLHKSFVATPKAGSVSTQTTLEEWDRWIAMYSSHDTGALCLAVNRNFVAVDRLVSDAGWIPYGSPLTSSVLRWKRRCFRDGRSSTTLEAVVVALLLLDGLAMPTGEHRCTTPQVARFVFVCCDEKQRPRCSTTSVDCLVMNEEERYEGAWWAAHRAQIVMLQRGGRLSINEWSVLMRMTPEDLRRTVVNAWVNHPKGRLIDFRKMCKKLFGRDDYAGAVRAVLLEEWLSPYVPTAAQPAAGASPREAPATSPRASKAVQ